MTAEVQHHSRRLTNAHLRADVDSIEQIDKWLNRKPLLSRDLGWLRPDEISHPLAVYLRGFANEQLSDFRSVLEFAVLRDNVLPNDFFSLSFDAFCGVLLQTHERLTNRAASFRTTSVNTSPDVSGSYIVYPDHALIRGHLREIYDFVTRHLRNEPASAAVLAMASIGNLHPFQDGNGRLARIMFNWIINLEKRSDKAYLPIYEISGLSRGGYLIHLRAALYQANWAPLFKLLADCAGRLFEHKWTGQPSVDNSEP